MDGPVPAVAFADVVVFTIAFVVQMFVAALILQGACKLAAGFKPTYGRAIGVILAGSFVPLFVLFLVGLATAALAPNADENASLAFGALMIIGTIIAHLWCYASMLVHSDTGPIGFGKAILVKLAELLINLAIALVLAGLFFGLALVLAPS